MKYVTIIIPKGEANLSCIAGTFEILIAANKYWRRIDKREEIEIQIAGFITELKLEAGYFSIHPANIKDIKNTDLLIIPPVSYNDNLVSENAELITWMVPLLQLVAVINRHL